MSSAARELLTDIWPFVWTTLAGIVAWYIRDTNAKISRLYGAVSEAERRIDAAQRAEFRRAPDRGRGGGVDPRR